MHVIVNLRQLLPYCQDFELHWRTAIRSPLLVVYRKVSRKLSSLVAANRQSIVATVRFSNTCNDGPLDDTPAELACISRTVIINCLAFVGRTQIFLVLATLRLPYESCRIIYTIVSCYAYIRQIRRSWREWNTKTGDCWQVKDDRWVTELRISTINKWGRRFIGKLVKNHNATREKV